jgi:sarcosine oxidase subunit gamma
MTPAERACMLKSLLDPCGIIRVQAWDCELPAPSVVEQLLDIAWPTATGAVVNGGYADILCTGPADWLMVSTDPDIEPLLERLQKAFEHSAYRATNMSSALRRTQIEGTHARALLSKGCGLDIHPQTFPPGRCARTRFAGIPVIVRCTEESAFQCIVAASYVEYLDSWLADAALEFSGTFA